MENALPRRTWSLCMTSENHGTVGPAGCTFSHAPEKHERVLVVEAPAGTRAPVAEFKGYVDGEPAVTWFDRDNMPRVGTKLFAGTAPASTVLTDERINTQRRIIEAQADEIAALKTAALHVAREVATQAGQVAVPEGWKLVPTHPDQFMINAFITEYERPGGSESGCYRAMLAAAPVTPAASTQAAPFPMQPAAAPAESIECWSHNEEDFSAQSLSELIDTHELQPGATVWVGEAVHPEPSSLFSTDWLIENMGEAAYDIAGEHGGEDYPNVSDEQVAELEALVVGWITKCAPPTFWTVKNVRPYVLTAGDCGDQASTSGERQEGGAA
jgi:hypothetical protein